MGKMKVKKGTVRIRMYNTEFGDCFLLGFSSGNNNVKYMLIDYGIHQGMKEYSKAIIPIAEKLKEATGGRIHLLVVTHEHADHMNGFKLAYDTFKDIRVENVWMGWTENYKDERVIKIDQIKKKYLNALTIAAAKLGLLKKNKLLVLGLRNILGFNDLAADEAVAAADSRNNTGPEGKKPSTNRDTMIWLQKHAQNGPEFHEPGGKVKHCDGIRDVNFYVLGPPDPGQLEFLKKEDPGSGAGKETYLSSSENDIYYKYVRRILKEDLGEEILFTDKYLLKDEGNHIEHIYNNSEDWRKIDDLQAEMLCELARRVSGQINNSSLVLAIELGTDGKVLLFPGDAQVGNWLSWKTHTWKNGNREITIDDLLARTVLYKVGHHGSHNATLKADGLEKMTNDELTAMIPVNEEYARKTGWNIPFPDLYDALVKTCRGRVLRSDRGLPSGQPYNLSLTEWDKFQKSVRKNETDSYIELDIEC